MNVALIAHRRQQLKHFSVSALLVITAAVLTLTIRRYFDGKAPLFFFTLAVLFAAGYGGAGPGFATALSFGVALLLFRDQIVVPVRTDQSSGFKVKSTRYATESSHRHPLNGTGDSPRLSS
jgi:hypothetical protein